MAPSPENDNTPKAPDKSCKLKERPATNWATTAPTTNNTTTQEDADKNISVTSLDDGQLKALLDEAITYKTPRDREGKSELFKTLLTDAEDEIRKAHARSASGPELARYYNTTANRRHRNKRQKSSVSENLTHGGSLNDLAKEELYESASNLQRPKKTVSARQREGGSLPCNVNAGASYDKQFFVEEQEKRKTAVQKMDTTIDMESESLLENDTLANEYNSIPEPVEMEVVQTRIPRIPSIYTSKATLQIGNVDDCVTFPAMERDKGASSNITNTIEPAYVHEVNPHYGLLAMNPKWPFSTARTQVEEKKVDENGNALSHSSATDTKKRKKSKKAEIGMKAEDVKGHRADIINNIDMLVEFISGNEEKKGVKKVNKNVSEGGGKQHKQRTRSSKGSKTATSHHLQKSTSMEEMSTTKLEDFHFEQEHGKSESGKVPLRSTKSNAERPRERKSWALCSELYQNASAENLESADFTYVTKKKKSKKRRNSLGSRKQTHSSEKRPAEFHRVPSPRRKSACSAPHSDKSNDSSDADSVHSLPLDSVEALSIPVSYADIAKSADKPKIIPPKKQPELSPVKAEAVVEAAEVVDVTPTPPAATVITNNKSDLGSLQNWPEIRNNKVNAVKNLESVQDWPTIQNNGVKSGVDARSPPKLIGNSVKKTPPRREDSLELQPPINCVRESATILNNTQQAKLLNQTESNQSFDSTLLDSLFSQSPQVIQKVTEQHSLMFPYQMPPNIRDVQSIEKMQLKSLQNLNNGADEVVIMPVVAMPVCEMDKRPAVVILSGGDKHISDITFGFDINEQLLSGDVCADFTSRFVLPEVNHYINYETVVNFIGSEWDDVMVQTNSGGKVKYYSEDL